MPPHPPQRPPTFTVPSAEDVDVAVGRRSEARGVARRGGGAGRAQGSPGDRGRAEAVEVVVVDWTTMPPHLTRPHPPPSKRILELTAARRLWERIYSKMCVFLDFPACPGQRMKPRHVLARAPRLQTPFAAPLEFEY